jgi:hypothetical protein
MTRTWTIVILNSRQAIADDTEDAIEGEIGAMIDAETATNAAKAYGEGIEVDAPTSVRDGNEYGNENEEGGIRNEDTTKETIDQILERFDEIKTRQNQQDESDCSDPMTVSRGTERG